MSMDALSILPNQHVQMFKMFKSHLGHFVFLTKNIQIMHLLLLKFIKSVGLLVPVEIPRHATRPKIKVLSYYKDSRLYCLYFSAVITDHSLKIKDNRKDHK